MWRLRCWRLIRIPVALRRRLVGIHLVAGSHRDNRIEAQVFRAVGSDAALLIERLRLDIHRSGRKARRQRVRLEVAQKKARAGSRREGVWYAAGCRQGERVQMGADSQRAVEQAAQRDAMGG